jgi:hypothetical protein
VKFLESGNVNAVDEPSFKRGSIFAKEPQFISDEMIKKPEFKIKGNKTNSRLKFIDSAREHCTEHKIVNFHDILSDLNKK